LIACEVVGVLGHVEGLSFDPAYVGLVVAHVPGLPNPSTNSKLGWACPGLGHMVRGSSTASPVGVHSRVARQEILGAIGLRPLQNRPVHLLIELGPTCDLKPSLSPMVGGEQDGDPEVRAGSERGNILIAMIVPLLPDLEAFGIPIGFGSARCSRRVILVLGQVAIRRGSRLISEVLGHVARKIRSVAPGQLILAQRRGHPTMASCLVGETGRRDQHRQLLRHAEIHEKTQGVF